MCCRDFRKEDLRDPRKKVSDEKYRDSIASEEKDLPLLVERGLSIDDHMNNYTKFLADLLNVNVAIKEEVKAVILLNSLPDEMYETLS